MPTRRHAQQIVWVSLRLLLAPPFRRCEFADLAGSTSDLTTQSYHMLSAAPKRYQMVMRSGGAIAPNCSSIITIVLEYLVSYTGSDAALAVGLLH